MYQILTRLPKDTGGGILSDRSRLTASGEETFVAAASALAIEGCTTRWYKIHQNKCVHKHENETA